MGTTLLMRMLAAHPAVVVYDRPPYEARGGKYWLHVLKTLAAPTDARKRVGAPMEFHLESLAAGGNPSTPPPSRPGRRWKPGRARPTSRIWPPSASAASTAGTWPPPRPRVRPKARSVYFAEKHFPDVYPRLMRELYPAARELFLVRDFRDMVASMRPTTRARDSATSDGRRPERRGLAGRPASRGRRPACRLAGARASHGVSSATKTWCATRTRRCPRY